MIMKAIRQGNLYMLTGETVQSGASHATVEADTDATKLWHMRLGHMSEKCLNVLHKRGVLEGVKQCKLDLCKFYIIGKHNRVSFKKLYYIHSNVWGLALINSEGDSLMSSLGRLGYTFSSGSLMHSQPSRFGRYIWRIKQGES